MQIFVPFLEMIERYNGMAMTPAAQDAPREADLDLPLLPLLEEPVPPALTLAANR